MEQRIQKIISGRGVTSRRKAEELILQGRVLCNGSVCVLGQQADPDRDEILIDGVPLPAAQQPVYLVLNKPSGYVTTLSDEKGRKMLPSLLRIADAGFIRLADWIWILKDFCCSPMTVISRSG